MADEANKQAQRLFSKLTGKGLPLKECYEDGQRLEYFKSADLVKMFKKDDNLAKELGERDIQQLYQ